VEQEGEKVGVLSRVQGEWDGTGHVDAAAWSVGHNPVHSAYLGNVVMEGRRVPAEDNAVEVEGVVMVSSSFPFRLKPPVQVPTSSPFRPSQLFEMRGVARDCVEHYFASQSSLLEVCRRGIAFLWLDKSAEGTWRQS
jgi:hypothetical protein